MKKTARINDLLFYLTTKSTFHLKELMDRYQISKSTALRDIQTIEELGLPIYSEKGRYGKYVLMETKIAAPLLFTKGELYALYLALVSLTHYRSMPFEVEANTLIRKYQLAVPLPIRKELMQLQQAVDLQQPKHPNESQSLSEIVQGIISESIFLIGYQKGQIQKNYLGQLLQLIARFGQWYVSIQLKETKEFRMLRCDKIVELCSINEKGTPLQYCLLERAATTSDERDCLFSVDLNEQGKDWFHKESYPTMMIEKQNNHYRLSGTYHRLEQAFIVNYLLSFGKNLLRIEPEALKIALIQESQERMAHLKDL